MSKPDWATKVVMRNVFMNSLGEEVLYGDVAERLLRQERAKLRRVLKQLKGKYKLGQTRCVEVAEFIAGYNKALDDVREAMEGKP